MTVCFTFFAVHGAALNMRASATGKGRAAGERHVVLGRSSIFRASSYRADPNLVAERMDALRRCCQVGVCLICRSLLGAVIILGGVLTPRCDKHAY